MLNSPSETDAETEKKRVIALVRGGPYGALVLAGIATAIVVALWFAFYVFVFVPRGGAP
jgi:hypothetical protein